jgi:hypothetical protein
MINQPIMDPFNLYVALTEEKVAAMEAAVEAYKRLPSHYDDKELSQWRDDSDAWAEATEEFCKAIRELNELSINFRNTAKKLNSNPYYNEFIKNHSPSPSKFSIWQKIKQFFNV